MSVKLREHTAVLVDGLIVLALGGLALGEIWTSPFAEPRPVNTFLFLSVCLALLWRRRAPLVVLLIAVTVLGIQANLFDPPDQPPLSSFIIFLVVSYSVAVHGEGRRAVVAAAAAFATEILIIDLPRLLAGENPGNIIPAWILYLMLWFVGRTIRQSRLQAERLQDLATQLELEREEKARTAVAEERSRISRELHDVVAHSVSVMVVQSQAAQRLLEGEQRNARQALESIETTGRQALTEMRRLLGILRRTDAELALAPQPGLEHLDALIEQTREAGLPVELSVEGDVGSLPPGVDLTAYRIVQEALTNTLKHAGPAHARVTIRRRDDGMELEVADDGAASGKGDGSGQGLIGMRERVALYGGALESGRRDGGGYIVRARLPLASNRT
ncbi:MAG: sensor histidine kinase [Rubrobacter sp.]|jgi:signal transduction histidine kinase|nr:sensor histidine kinase [Rubrobacter sp.]MBA3790349.1 sensor histidine kinase [Rubrobacter sp.]